MAQHRTITRLAGALLAVGLVAGIGLAFFANSGKRTPPIPGSTPATGATTPQVTSADASVPGNVTPPTAVPGATGPTGAAATPPTGAGAASPAATAPPAATATGTTLAPLGVLSLKPAPASALTPIGSVNTGSGPGTASGSGYEMEVEFSPLGAGIESLRLARHFDTIKKDHKPYVVQRRHEHAGSAVVPLAALELFIADGSAPVGQRSYQRVALGDPTNPNVWTQVAPGAFRADVVDAAGQAVAAVHRVYRLDPGRFDLLLEQYVENLSGRDLIIRLTQLGPVDLDPGTIRYGGDLRRSRVGVVPAPSSSPDGQTVLARDHLLMRAQYMRETSTPGVFEPLAVWPPADPAGESLAFVALTNRFFAAALSAAPELQAKRSDGLPNKAWASVARVDRVVLPVPDAYGAYAHDSVGALLLTSADRVVPAGQRGDLSMRLYAGPMSNSTLASSAELESMGLPGLRVFTMGGPCGCCTFQPVAIFLRGFLGLLHDYVLFDWALAIIALVLCVKTLLHPITYWSQAKIQRFAKQMSAVAPKLQKLKEKYKDDPKRFREEQIKLMREEQVDYGGALGCFPMLLQTPIWIALYAMVMLTFELRHEGAFFGLFQAISGGSWGFLGDLAEPDNFIPLGFSFNIPLLSGIIGPIESINLLPLILGAVFYVQQKYLTPPPTTPLSPEQETTQKIMKFMIVVMFPLLMYNAPSALAIYFITNSTVGIIESKRIRAKVKAEDDRREELKKAAASNPNPRRRVPNEAEQPKGFFARMQDAVERRQKELDERRALREKEAKKRKGS